MEFNAKAIGWSPSTVALYEVGEIPTKSNNRLLKVMIKDSNVMKEFIVESKADSDLEEL
ncbi:MAG: xre family toxin-antitoxin system [Lactobacillus gallinarum]|uniref:xre family toxin-antitoxin system n=1 Tax=Lactobacillus gallinarum TaxID=52242 RepID=UPI0038083F14